MSEAKAWHELHDEMEARIAQARGEGEAEGANEERMLHSERAIRAARAAGYAAGIEAAARECLKRERYHRDHEMMREPLPQIQYMTSEARACGDAIRALAAGAQK